MKLVDVMGLEFGRSKKWFGAVLVIGCLIQMAGIISILIGAAAPQKVFGLLAAIAQLALFACKRMARYHHSLGEEIRRIAMLFNGMGLKPSEDQIASLRDRIGDPDSAKPEYSGGYYDSKLEPGYNRLAEITRESAFWTSALARSSGRVYGLLTVSGLAISVLLFVLTVEAGAPQPVLDLAAKVVLASMTFWITGDFATLTLQFWSLSTTASRIQSQCSNLLSKGGNVSDAIHVIVAEYNCALVQAPPIPDFIYRCRQHQLNEAWRKRTEATA